ncbi:MAG: choice-of-anchor B family protein, partial [Planctomycetes bacterium]|nr:choice-of-anchor B family protein [Planctomycetota bacterium]
MQVCIAPEGLQRRLDEALFTGDETKMKAQNGCRLTLILTLCALQGLVAYRPAVAGEFPTENTTLLSWLDVGDFGSGSGNDCWGYTAPSGREYALAGLDNKVAVVEITDPINPVIIGSVSHSSSIWGDVKVFQSYAYAVNESGGGIDVIDLSEVDSGSVSLVRRVTSNGMQTAHNVAVNTDSGFLYLAGGNLNGGALVAWDLSNPTNPVLAGQHNGGSYLHDVQVVTYTSGPNAGREIAFGASEGRGIDIIDCTDKGAMFLISRTPYPNVDYCHQAWTEDLRYLYINDELDGIQRTTVMDILDLVNPIVLGDYNNGTGSTDHNIYVRDGIVFEADYHAGLRIFDANSDPVQPPQIGWFDSYPPNDNSGFDGAWSCYPFFPSGTVIVSDINRGLFMVDISDALGSLEFTYPNGRPELIDPNGGTRMRVEVSGRGDSQPVPGTGELHYDVGEGWVAEAMEEISDNVYDAVFPAADCAQEVAYYVSSLSTDESVQTDPSNAPDNAYSVVAASGEDVFFADDFEADLGWSVQDIDVQTGTWERAVPAGGGGRGDPATDFDGSGKCFVTDNRFEEDVDGGPTMLFSPTFDVSNRVDPQLTYARWFTNNDGDQDRLDVHISDDNGASWTLIESVAGGSGWVVQTIRIADFVQLTPTVKVRFSATDNPNDSVTEAAIDAVAIFDYVCDQAPLLCIVHGDPDWDRNDSNTWTSFEDWAFSAYIDNKVESTDGVNRDLGLT